MFRYIVVFILLSFTRILCADSETFYSLARIRISPAPDSSFILKCRIDRTAVSVAKEGDPESVRTESLFSPEYKFKVLAIGQLFALAARAPSQQLSLKFADGVLSFEQKPGFAMHILSGKQTDSGFHLAGTVVFSILDGKSQKILLYPFDSEFKFDTVYYVIPQENRYPEPIKCSVDTYLSGIDKDISPEDLKKYPVKF